MPPLNRSAKISVRLLIQILRFVSYVTLLPYLASAMSASFATCLPGDSFSGFVLAGVTFLIIIGYGNTLAHNDPIPADSTFWISTIFFYIVCASLVVNRSYDGFFRNLMTSFTRFHDAFIPQYEQYLALGSVGGLSFVALTVWMPAASILSLIVFLTLLSQRRLMNQRAILEPTAEQDAPSNGGNAPV